MFMSKDHFFCQNLTLPIWSFPPPKFKLFSRHLNALHEWCKRKLVICQHIQHTSTHHMFTLWHHICKYDTLESSTTLKFKNHSCLKMSSSFRKKTVPCVGTGTHYVLTLFITHNVYIFPCGLQAWWQLQPQHVFNYTRGNDIVFREKWKPHFCPSYFICVLCSALPKTFLRHVACSAVHFLLDTETSLLHVYCILLLANHPFSFAHDA